MQKIEYVDDDYDSEYSGEDDFSPLPKKTKSALTKGGKMTSTETKLLAKLEKQQKVIDKLEAAKRKPKAISKTMIIQPPDYIHHASGMHPATETVKKDLYRKLDTFN